MDTKRIIPWLLLACLIVTGLCADTPVQTDQNSGFRDVATPSFDVGPMAKVSVGGLLPGGCKGFYLYAYGGPLAVGPTSDLASDTSMPLGVVVSSGSYLVWTGLSPDSGLVPNIYAISNSTATVTCKLICW